MATTAILVPATRSTRHAARFAALTLGFFILVVLWGAVVRASGSGGGCGASWPLCNGGFFPHHPRLATVIEFAHRSTSGICTLLDLTLIAWTFAVTPRRHRARAAVLSSAAFLILEAAFGAVLVLRHYVEDNSSTGRIVMQSIHFTNTMLLMASLALVVRFLREDREKSGAPARPTPLWTTWLAIVATITVGATGSLAALADTLYPSATLSAAIAQDFAASSPMLIRMRWLHPASALISFVCVLLLLRASAFLRKPVVAFLAAQVVLGIADVLLLAPIWLQLLHLLTADLYWIALVVLAAQNLWPVVAPPRAEISVPTQTIVA